MSNRTKSPSTSRAKSKTPAVSEVVSQASIAPVRSSVNTSKHEGDQNESEILISGMLYDVKGFKHPGGSIIKFNTGTNGGDATEAFTEFHFRSPKAQKMLKLLPCRPAPLSDKPPTVEEKRYAKMTRDFADLRQNLVKEGWFDPDMTHVAYRVTELIVMHMVGIYLLLATSYALPALMLLGVASGRCGWLMHEGGHGSLTGNRNTDIRMQECIYGLGCGMSGGWWRNQHNKHHATPQKLKHDVDLDTLPLVAFHAKVGKLVGKKSALLKAWIKVQNYTFAPVTCFLVTNFWQLFLHPRYVQRTKRYMEAVWMVMRYVIMGQIAQAYGADLSTFLLGYLIYDMTGGCYIFTNFALSHTHLDVVEADNNKVHWLEYAGTYTININPIAPVNWWMGYLNFQIEHHLFPSMPQYKFAQLSPRIQELFKANGIKYDVRGFFGAMSDTWSNLATVAQGV